jgi:hypothetical protein
MTAAEILRHNCAMECIAESTANIETTKTNVKIGVISLDNEQKSLELTLQKHETYMSLKAKGMSDKRILIVFPSLAEFITE